MTERLKLIPISMDFAQIIFENFTPEVTQYMWPSSPKEISETEAFIDDMLNRIRKGEEICLVIMNKKNNEFLGIVGMHKANTSMPELGIWLKKAAHRNKYGLEAVTALKKWAEQHLDYQYLVYPVDKQNIASRKISETLGGVVEAEYQKRSMSGRLLDEVEYRIYKKVDWRQITLRKATSLDARCVADIYLSSRKKFLSFVPLMHSDKSIYQWVSEKLIPSNQVIVAEQGGVIVGMMVLSKNDGIGWIEQLYLSPNVVGHGIGALLVEEAKIILGSPIRLHTFRENAVARRFYERHSFHILEFGDGSTNEENCPDILYEWRA